LRRRQFENDVKIRSIHSIRRSRYVQVTHAGLVSQRLIRFCGKARPIQKAQRTNYSLPLVVCKSTDARETGRSFSR